MRQRLDMQRHAMHIAACRLNHDGDGFILEGTWENTMGLLDIRDQLAAVRHLFTCLQHACPQLQAKGDRAALCAVCAAIREKVQTIDTAVGELIGGDGTSW